MNKVLPKTNFKNQENTVLNELPKTKYDINTVVFSFSMFKCKSIKSKTFNNCFYSMWEYGEWSISLMYKLHEFSSNSPAELKQAGRSTRCHLVEGNELEKLKELLIQIGLNEGENSNQIMEEGYFELSLGQSEGRIFGYFIDNIFYILILDPHHTIYVDERYGYKQDLLSKNYDPWKLIG